MCSSETYCHVQPRQERPLIRKEGFGLNAHRGSPCQGSRLSFLACPGIEPPVQPACPLLLGLVLSKSCSTELLQKFRLTLRRALFLNQQGTAGESLKALMECNFRQMSNEIVECKAHQRLYL